MTTQPTEAKKGVKTFTCTRCRTTKTEPIARLTGCDGGNNCPSRRFTDVPKPPHWMHAGIDFVVENNLFLGTSDTTFSPNEAMTRAMLVTVLWRLEGKPKAGTQTAFKDVPAGEYYAQPVAWAAANGIVKGTSSTTFSPDGKITREQMAAILYRYAQQKGYDTTESADLSKFPDNGKVSAYARQALAWANAEGLINGDKQANGTVLLDPAGKATRAQVAAILARFCENICNISSYTVTFLRNDGSEAAYRMDTVAPNTCVSEPEAPTRLDGSFIGWYTEEAAVTRYDFSQPVRRNLTLYAGWDVEQPEESEGLSAYSYGGETLYSITGIQMLNHVVAVTLNTNSAATLTVEFLDEKTQQVLATVSTRTPDHCELSPISILVEETLPQYYLIRATLYDDNGAPLCKSMFCIEYTSAYAQFDAQTVDDFEGQTVLNFDEDKTNNFGVINGEVVEVVTTATTNALTVTLEDSFPASYTFASPDKTVKDLQVGEKVLVTGTNEQPYMFKVASIKTKSDGSLTLLPDQDVSLSEFYDFLKVDMKEADDEGAPLDTKGLITLDAPDLTAKLEGSEKWNFTERLALSFSVEGSAKIGIKIEYDKRWIQYTSWFGWLDDYFYCSITSEVTLKTEITLEYSGDNDSAVEDAEKQFSKELALPGISVPTPVPGLYVTVTPGLPVEMKLSISGTLTITSKQKNGFVYDTLSGMQKTEEKESTTELNIKGEFKLTAGPKISIGVAFLSNEMITAELNAQIGVEATGTAELLSVGITNSASKHACDSCIKGEIKGFFKIGCELSVCFIKDIFEVKVEPDLLTLEFNIPISSKEPGKFYISLVNESDSIFGGKPHFGFGECPNKTWRVSIETIDGRGNAIDAEVEIKKQGDSQKVYHSTSWDPHVYYLYKGNYTVSASIDGVSYSKDFTVNEEAQVITLSAGASQEETYAALVDAYKEACDFYADWMLRGVQFVYPDGTMETYENGRMEQIEIGVGDYHVLVHDEDITTGQQLQDALHLHYPSEKAKAFFASLDPIEHEGKLYITPRVNWGTDWEGIDTIEAIEKTGSSTYEMQVSGTAFGGRRLTFQVNVDYVDGQYRFYSPDDEDFFIFYLDYSDFTSPSDAPTPSLVGENRYTLASEIKDGDVVVVMNPLSSTAISTKDYMSGYWQLDAASVTTSDGILATDATNVEFTVSVDANGYCTFTADGKYLTAGETGSTLAMKDSASDYSLWKLVKTDGGWHIQSVNATSNGHPQYIEWYNYYTTYEMADPGTSYSGFYLFNFYKK